MNHTINRKLMHTLWDHVPVTLFAPTAQWCWTYLGNALSFDVSSEVKIKVMFDELSSDMMHAYVPALNRLMNQ